MKMGMGLNMNKDLEQSAIYDFTCGRFSIACCDGSITKVEKTNRQGKGSPCEMTDRAALQLEEYFSGKRISFDLPIAPCGTDFQKRVWAALQNIPYGETRSYKDIACAIERPTACRAVGGANNKNPILIIIPCHRVVGSNGALVGFGGGLEMKQMLLDLEQNNGRDF